MTSDKSIKTVKIAVFCIMVGSLNILFTNFFRNYLGLPLFMDTVFNAAVTFAFGLIPGIFTAILTWIVPCIYWKDYNFFILCSIAEVLIICALKPAVSASADYPSKERVLASYLVIGAKLMLLYIICALVISILGGIIDYISQIYIDTHMDYYHIENTFKLALMLNNLPPLAVNILSRIPINIVDRFIVIFGGYLVSRGLVKVFNAEGAEDAEEFLKG